MFGLLNTQNDKLYSFGQISSSSQGSYTVSYKSTQICIVTSLEFEIGDWVILYGSFKKDILYVKYIEKLIGVNIQILERIAKFLEETDVK